MQFERPPLNLLGSSLVFRAKSTTGDYIMAEGDFHKEIIIIIMIIMCSFLCFIVERTNRADIRPEEQSEKT